MTSLVVPVAPCLSAYKPFLREFWAGMVFKLAKNSHKATPSRNHIEDIIGLLEAEIDEFREQLNQDKFDNNSLMELFDAANFAFLAYLAMRMDGVKTEQERLIDELLRIDPVEGKVYCAKTRAGSQYKVGEEIKGTNRAGYIDIRLQVASHNRGMVLPRSHLVWWKAKGRWPVGVIDHGDRVRSNDRIDNLSDTSMSENSFNNGRERLLPRYVTQYTPTGRQHLSHYGKYVYQRRVGNLNIRCAYYDTPEQAAVQGELDWIAKTTQKQAA